MFKVQRTSVLPPGPKGHWLLGSLKEKWHTPAEFFESNRELYGDIASFKLGPVRIFQLNAPLLIGEHFHSKSETCIRGRGFEKLRPVLGEGLFTAEGNEWRAGREQVRPCFSKSKVDCYESIVRQVGTSLCDSLPERGVIDAKLVATKGALQVVFATLLDIPWDESFLVINEYTEAVKTTAHKQIHGLWSRMQWLPTRNNMEFWRATRALRALTEELIELGRRHSKRDSFLGSLIARYNSGAISKNFLLDQVITIVITGHETVANTLCWGLELLALHPSKQNCFAEAAKDFDLPENRAYLESTVKEIIRLYPAAWMISHEVVRPHQIGNWSIPSGALIFVVPYTVHRDPRLWKQPNDFMPERFVASKNPSQIDRYRYIPFGGGARFCIGRTLAELEIRIILEEIAKRFRLSSKNAVPTEPEFSMTLRPKTHLELVVMRTGQNLGVIKSDENQKSGLQGKSR